MNARFPPSDRSVTPLSDHVVSVRYDFIVDYLPVLIQDYVMAVPGIQAIFYCCKQAFIEFDYRHKYVCIKELRGRRLRLHMAFKKIHYRIAGNSSVQAQMSKTADHIFVFFCKFCCYKGL